MILQLYLAAGSTVFAEEPEERGAVLALHLRHWTLHEWTVRTGNPAPWRGMLSMARVCCPASQRHGLLLDWCRCGFARARLVPWRSAEVPVQLRPCASAAPRHRGRGGRPAWRRRRGRDPAPPPRQRPRAGRRAPRRRGRSSGGARRTSRRAARARRRSRPASSRGRRRRDRRTEGTGPCPPTRRSTRGATTRRRRRPRWCRWW
mmetsp:Transcript_13738/g.23480  ORF Transcript_13738/g.23480 Transcript_13738/m.23480 type:complete len:204 (-) Transcript_13738:570-1181(-)